MSPPKKYYVVWAGHSTGVFDNWNDCKKQVSGYEKALYKAFPSREEADKAFTEDPFTYIRYKSILTTPKYKKNDSPVLNSLSVDAACEGNPGKMEYRGVHVETKKVWFHQEFPLGTNNIGEFLALVHGLAELKRQNLNIPVYTDSQTALAWVRNKKCATKLIEKSETQQLFKLIKRAEKWLKTEDYQTILLKWKTKSWGEIPADFGRK